MRSNRSSGCPCRAVIQFRDDQWHVDVTNAVHNHEAFDHPSAHPQGRSGALTSDHTQSVFGMLRALVPTSRITTTIQHNTGVMLTGQDVRNSWNKEQNAVLNGRSRITALLDNLSNDPSHFWQVDNKQNLTHLLVVSHCAREICQKFCAGKVWLLDATYKTNKFGVHLFHVVCATASH